MTAVDRCEGARLASAHGSHVGRVRASNEDVVVDEPQDGFYGVFDGMGGAEAGEVAARIASASILGAIRRCRLENEARLLRAALVNAGRAVFTAAEQIAAWRGMGTTAVVCSARDPRRAHIAHVGDSRAYLARAGELRALTKDHTVIQSLIDRGAVDSREAATHPMRNVLSRNLGACADVRPDDVVVDLRTGDRILLCSDGLTGYAEEAAIVRVLVANREPARAVAALLQLALAGGGGDNVSVVVVDRIG